MLLGIDYGPTRTVVAAVDRGNYRASILESSDVNSNHLYRINRLYSLFHLYSLFFCWSSCFHFLQRAEHLLQLCARHLAEGMEACTKDFAFGDS